MDGKFIIEEDKKYIANTYSRFPVAFKDGKGCRLYDFDGKEYIDCGSGIGVDVFGVNDEEWKKAVIAQLNKVQHTSNLYYTEPAADLAKLLCGRTGAKKVFFGNSGAEANECAIKAARKYGEINYGPSRKEIITLKNSFHGRTLATLAATGQDGFHKYYGPFPAGFVYADADAASVESCMNENTCAVMVECIQGESGVNVLGGDFLKAVEKLCKERDILLICDEVQTGNGRTGRLYSYENYGLRPDIVTTAKGLGGGLPIGACMMFEKCAGVFGYGDHGSTFGGNPVVCAGAINILSRIDKELLEKVREKGEYFTARLKEIEGVEEVSGLGLMIGIKTAKPAAEIAAECVKRGLLVLTAHSRVRLLPPLTISKDEIDFALKILNEVIRG
ncbi:MAG TPA: aspartate aminotransferase family protein [Candidatus Coproplasma excrementigallinarum]|uniref:Acetylornithine aminotransferase n=1 Tax=Candidatus Coproplasma excrementigallinarum TaxID=2840747 RepID=A0A9D1SIA3_9FIRM|nr:aspartate aminotransferase family protein [Candidatus Coproplasma excrementigallinarum]